MRRTARRSRRGAVAVALAAGVIGVAAAPSGAQDPDPTTSTSSTTTVTTAPTTPTTAPPATTTPTTPATGGDAVPEQPAPSPPATGTTTATTAVPPTTVTPPATTPQAGPEPLAAAAVTLDPANDMGDGTPVTITVTGLPAGAWVEALQCTSAVESETPSGISDHCDGFDVDYTDGNGDGTATLTLRVDALLTAGWDEPEVTDCRVPGACVIAVLVDTDDGSIEGRQVLTAPVAMAVDAPLAPPPAVSVVPDDALTDAQTVDVTASGLVWSRSAMVLQCAADPVDETDCDTGTVRYLETDASGALATRQRAFAVIDTGRGPVDCRVPGSCVMVATQDLMRTPGRFAAAGLTFDPATEVVPPTLTVSPASGLVDGQLVTVTGSGFVDEYVELYLCPPDPADGCRLTDGWGFIEDGGFTSQVEVEAIVATPAGEVDCRTSAEPCLVVASRGLPTSPRAGRAELHFTPDGPLRPPPTITLDPATDLPGEGLVTVTGRNFTTSSFAEVLVEVCTVGGAGWCDPQAETYVPTVTGGRFTVDVDVAATFTVGTTVVDCRAAPGCEVVASLGFNGRQARAALDFAPPSPPDDRYVEPVFPEVEVSRDIVYRSTTSASGAPVDLMLDIYEPAGDSEEQRPVVVWLHGGWFGGGSRADMAAYATAFAQRGYVAVSMAYRQSPGLHCCPTNDVEGVTDAVLASYDDARAGVRWLRAHADEYRIDRRAIAAGGVSAGATAAANLAHLPGQMGRSGASPIAAALPIAGVDTGRPDAGEPPMLAFHARGDNTAPLHLSQTACARAERLGATCRTVAYDGVWQPATQRQRDIIRRSGDFLAEVVLDPLGYVDWTGPTTPPTGPPVGQPSSPPSAQPPVPVVPLPVALTAATPGSGAA
ncbi:MAG: neocarzinostatin apoprotein domain-containing protein, partial [Acidimicrobiales bacterium]